MNQGHAELCGSARWAEFIASEVLPAALAGQDPGDRILEIGPGYGAATALLTAACDDLTAVEVDPVLAARLRDRFPTITVVEGGIFAGSDSIASPGLRRFHHDDIYTPVDPDTLAQRLIAAGYSSAEIRVVADDEWFSFVASRA